MLSACTVDSVGVTVTFKESPGSDLSAGYPSLCPSNRTISDFTCRPNVSNGVLGRGKLPVGPL